MHSKNEHLKKVATTMVVLVGACVLASPTEKNLLANGDFESGDVRGWGNWNGAQSTLCATAENAYGGSYSLAYTHRGERGSATAVSTVRVAPGETYTVSGWMRGEAGQFATKVFWFGKGGVYKGELSLHAATRLADWQCFEQVVVAPDETVCMQVGVVVSLGTAYFDDLRVVRGNQVKAFPNLILNSAFTYCLHENGMPEYWNTGGSYSFDALQPGAHEGQFYRMAPEEQSPEPGTHVLFVRQVGRTQFCCGSFAGNSDYTFSVWARSDDPAAKLTLQAPFLEPREKTFALTNVWRRYSFTGFLKASRQNCFPTLDYGRHAMYLAAPMIHAGKELQPWRPSPNDAHLVDFRAGEQKPSRSEIVTVEVPNTPDRACAATLCDFYALREGKPCVRGKYRVAVRQWQNVLQVDVACDSGKKPAVVPTAGQPLVLGNDAVECFLTPAESGARFIQFMGGRNGACAATWGSQGKALGPQEKWTYRASETPTGWQAAFEIPLGLFSEPGGRVWRMNVGVTDFDGASAHYFSLGKDGFNANRTFVRLKGLPRGICPVMPRVHAEYDFYTREKTVRVRTFDVVGSATLRLQDETGRVWDEKGVAGAQDLDLAADQLPDGYYEVHLLTAIGSAKTHFRKIKGASAYSRIDRFRQCLEKDGKPFFPMVYSWDGFSGKLPTAWQIAALKARHFNTILIQPEMYSSWIARMTPEYRRDTVKAFVDAGFKILVWSSTNVDLKKEGVRGLVAVRKKQIEELAPFADHIIGWYYVDEISPDWEKNLGFREADFAWGYREMKAFDPARFHFINWGWTSQSEGCKFYAEDGATDFYSLDCYPYTQMRGYGVLSTHETAARILHERIEDTGMPGMMWLQTYNYYEGIREPMPVEYRNNVYISLINHVVGFMHFIGCPQNKDLWDEMGTSYGTALKWLEMTVGPGATCLVRGKQNSVSYALWKDGHGGYALVTANTLCAPQGEKLEEPAAVLGEIGGWRVKQIGGEGVLTIGPDGSLMVDLPTAGSAAWFLERQ